MNGVRGMTSSRVPGTRPGLPISAFSESSISTLSAIIHDDPVPATHISAGLPGDADKVIRRCLRKDPERRFQHIMAEKGFDALEVIS